MTPTTTDADAMLRAVLTDPRDDTARLVFADAVEEAGDVRLAASIRYALWVDRANRGDPADMPPVEHHLNGRGWLEDMGVITFMDRGFVSEVRLTCAAFLRDGFARELFSRHPVTSVALTDKRPYLDNPPGLAGAYMWFRRASDDPRERAAHLPPPLFGRLAAGTAGALRDVGVALTAAVTLEDAAAALSAVCVAWGREQAGLPPLPGGAA